MISRDFFAEENKESLRLFLKNVCDDFIDFKISSSATCQTFDKNLLLNISSSNLPIHEVDIENTYKTFLNEIIPFCQNPSSQNFLGFPYSGNSVPGVIGSLISDFLNINLVDFKLSEALTFCEIETIIWLRKLIEYDCFGTLKTIADVGGIHTHGGAMSNTIALILAREQHCFNKGLKSVNNSEEFKIIVPKGITHYGVYKSQMLIGCGSNCIEIPTLNHRMEPRRLEEAILENNEKIMAVVVFAGDAKTGTIENLSLISDLVKNIDPRIWLHVDASQGFCLAFSDSLKYKLTDLKKFDSITVDPHKCLNVPFSISTLLVKDPTKIRIFDNKETDEEFNFSLGQITPFISSRPAIALKLWFTLKTFGKTKISSVVENRYSLAQAFAELIRKSNDFILINNPDTFSVIFCYAKKIRMIESENDIEYLNDLNDKVEKELSKQGYFLDRPKINEVSGTYSSIILRPLKYLSGNPRTKLENLTDMITLIRQKFTDDEFC